MGVAENEVDFPRGGTAVERTPKSTKSTEPISKGDGDQLFGVAKKRKSKGKQNESEQIPTKKKKLEAKAAVWSKPINMELLTDGVMGVGIVTEVHEDYVLMETADSCRVRLPATQISKKFTELLKLQKISLESAFVVGQVVPFRVTQRSTAPTKKGKGAVKDRKPSLPIVSCDPSKLYSHMSPAQLVPGLVLAGIVESVEEKGAVLDIGMQSTQAFLPVKKQQRPVEVGQPVLVRVEGGRTSRVVAVTSYVEQDNLSLEACESLNLNHLTPGTIIDCEPDAEPSITAGIYVTLGNGVRGFVAKSHLPPRLRGDITKLGRSLRCVVMFCQQNSPLLVLSAHPDIVAISKPEKRASFLGYSIGDRVKCKVIDIVPSSFLVCFSLPAAEDGKTPLVSAISYKKYLKKPEELETLYSIGSEHMCRVMGFRYVDRCLVVSTRKDLLNQKFVTYKDATPGELVEAKVTDVHPRGVQVAVNDFVKGFIPLDQLADKKVAQEKVFIVGKPVKCRVLFINEVKRQVWLTARPSLVNYKGTLLTSYDSKNEGVTTIGYVVKILETGGAVLQFFGSVRGLLLANEVKRIGGEVKPGQIVEVRVMSVNEADNRMTLAVADESAASTGRVVNPKASDLNPEQCGTVAVVDEVSESGVGGRKSEKALVHLESNPSIKGCILPNLVSDSLDSPLESLRNTLRCGMKLDPVSLLGSLGGVNRFTTKRFVHDWIHTFQKGVPKSFEDLKMGQMVCGVISQRVVDECVYVEIVGGCGLVGKAALEDIEGGKDGIDCLQIGQTVIGRIRKVNAEKNTFRISLKIYNCVPEKQLSTKAPSSAASLALQLLRSSVEEIAVFAESAKLPAPGVTVVATTSQIVDDILFVTFNEKLMGCVRKGNYKDGVKVGDKIKCIVIDYVFPRNDAELVMIDTAGKSDTNDKSKKKKKNKEETPEATRVILTKRDYIAVLRDGCKLVFVPSRFHPNQVVELKNARVSCTDVVELGDTVSVRNNVDIGLLKGDEELIVKLIASSKKASKSFPGKKSDSKTSDSPKSKAELGITTKSVKNLCTYTGTVIGPWTSDDRHDYGRIAALIELPGGQIGRLHASELPAKLLENSVFPMEEFIKRNLKKTVVVRVINIMKVKRGDSKVRIAELTMVYSKLAEKRKKASLLAFQTVFKPGDLIRCFVVPNQEMTSKAVRVEINPLWSGQIAHEAISEDMKVEAPDRDGELFECLPKGGEMRWAKVLSIVKMKKKCHRCGVLNLAFDTRSNLKKFEPGERITARVTHVNHHPLNVQFHLSNGQQAILCATAIASNYEKVQQHIANFKQDGIFHLYALRQDQNPQRNYLCAEGRYETYLKQKDQPAEKENRRRLLVDRSLVTTGMTCDGFVAKHSPDAVLVEIGPGIVGRIRKVHHPEINSIPLNSVITIRVRSVDSEGRISLTFVAVVCQGVLPGAQDRKRPAEEASVATSKKGKKEQQEVEELEKVSLPDPGFDWSNSGFRPEDLAAVGKLGVDEDKPSGDDSKEPSNEVQKPSEGKKERQKEKKKVMTKEEEDMEKERKLVSREVELAGDFEPETQEDFTRLLRKDPNSAEIWIRYISFFLGKNDLTKARATAERALTVINYREEAEIFNIWTAFLNMEVAYGDENSAKEVFKRACGNADAFKMHKQMAAIYSDAGKNEEANEIFDAMVKKFRANSDDVWTLYGEHLMKTERTEEARELMKRALASVPKQRHVPLISRFAQMEFRHGDVERGRTLFESLVTAYPKKTDQWLVYADLCLKHSGIEMTRQVLERACALPLGIHKLRPLFRKWMEAEERYGDDESRSLVKQKAEKYLRLTVGEQEAEASD